MTIYTNSRYVNQTIALLVINNTATPTVFRTRTPMSTRFLHHVAVQGERFDLLANVYLGDPTQWWQIADANPEVFYPDAIIPGSVLRIPVLV